MMDKYNKTKIKPIILYAVLVVVLTFVDQVTKIAATGLKGKTGVPVVEGVFELFYLENTGTAWGMFAGARYIFLIITCIVIAIITYIVVKIPFNKKYVPLYISMVLLAAGGLGNFVDRLFLGYVRDFLYFKLIDFPVFNVADSYVTIGLVILIILIMFVYNEKDFGFLPFVKDKSNEQ